MDSLIILIGAGGHAKSVIDSINGNENKAVIKGFLDSYKQGSHLGYRVLFNNIHQISNPKNYHYFICVGDNRIREKWFLDLERNELKAINIIDKTAIVSKGVIIGKGVFIGKSAIVNNGAQIGNNVIINTRALVEHGCKIADHANVSTNSVVNGDVLVERGAFVGSSSVVNGQLKIGQYSVIGSGSVVIRDVEPLTVVAGVPAKIIKSRDVE